MVLIWLITIGCVWGLTNALIKRGATIAEKQKLKQKTTNTPKAKGIRAHVDEWIVMLCVWQYSLPFVINLSASALFFMKLNDAPITLAVPVTNAVTFGATAISGAAFGEKMDGVRTVLGITLIIIGVCICVSPTQSIP